MYKLRVYFTVCPHLFMDKAKQQRTKPPQPHQLSYLFSTSNHNLLEGVKICERIVLYLFSTSNHNKYFRTPSW